MATSCSGSCAPVSGAERILATGYADLTAVIRAVNDGQIFAYVTKPWDPEDLRVKIHRALVNFASPGSSPRSVNCWMI